MNEFNVSDAAANGIMIERHMPPAGTADVARLDAASKAGVALATFESKPGFHWENQRLDWESMCYKIANEICAGVDGDSIEQWEARFIAWLIFEQLEIFGMTDQPETCGLCCGRPAFIIGTTKNKQVCHCGCGHMYRLEE